MTIKQTKTVYISDRNQEFFLDEMQFSHLLNAHAHHRKQIQTLEGIVQGQDHPSGYCLNKLSDLKLTLSALEYEIANRREDNEPDNEKKYGRYDCGY